MLSSVRLIFGDRPADWDRRLPLFALWAIVFVPLPYLLTLTQMPDVAAIDPLGSLHAAISAALLALALFVTALAIFLVFARRAEGVLLLAVATLFLCPVLVTLALSAGPMASAGMVLATLGLALWCAGRIWRGTQRIREADIAAFSAEVIATSPDGRETILLSSRAQTNGELLRQLLRKAGFSWLSAVEAIVPFVIIAQLPGTLAMGVDGSSEGYAGALAWFLWAELFVLSRQMVIVALLRWRAIRHHEARRAGSGRGLHCPSR